jgi:hypothetical protein
VRAVGTFFDRYRRMHRIDPEKPGPIKRDQKCNDPLQECTQDAWVKLLSKQRKKALPVPNAVDFESLFDAYSNQEGYLQESFGLAQHEANHALYGQKNSPNKRIALKSLQRSLGELSLDGTVNTLKAEAKLVPDVETGYARVEAAEDVALLLGSLEVDDRAVVEQFIEEWERYVDGGPVPDKVRKRASRARRGERLRERGITLSFEACRRAPRSS